MSIYINKNVKKQSHKVLFLTALACGVVPLQSCENTTTEKKSEVIVPEKPVQTRSVTKVGRSKI